MRPCKCGKTMVGSNVTCPRNCEPASYWRNRKPRKYANPPRTRHVCSVTCGPVCTFGDW